MRLRLARPSKPTLFAILMVASACVALLPARWTGCVNGVAQPLGWFQWAVSGGARRTLEHFQGLGVPPPTPAEVRELRRQNEELARRLRHQQVTIAQLESRIAELTGLREQLDDHRAKIILASVVAGDASPRRDTLTISRGQRHGVRLGDWVAAGSPAAEYDPAETGRDLLLRQWLIGRVSEVYPYLSRVQLTTDAQFGPQRVWTARPTPEGSWELGAAESVLRGLGNGRMRIDRASENFLEAGQTVVLVPLVHPRPLALAVGRIVGARRLETGLHYDLEVEPWGDARRLGHVYVISFHP